MPKTDKKPVYTADRIKIVLTGGHAATTALATIEELIKTGIPMDMYWIGARSAVEGKRVPTLESKIFPGLGVRHHPIIMGRLQRKWTVWTLPAYAKIPFGFLHALILLIKIRPKIILSFGGYVAFPVVFGGWLLRIPVIVHEQTTAVGLSNKLSAHFANRIAISREESRSHFPQNKVVLTGNPILSEIKAVTSKPKPANPPVIYIAGGSRGSQTINNAVREVLVELLTRYKVIHQTGQLDFASMEKVKSNLPKNLEQRYEVYDFINPQEIGAIYQKSDIVVARGGANTVSEIIITKRPAVIIPIPWTRYDEQNKNAQKAAKIGLATVITQDDLTGSVLLEKINDTYHNWVKIVRSVPDTKNLDYEASTNLINLLRSYLT